MSETDRIKYLRIALVLVGIVFILGFTRSPSFGLLLVLARRGPFGLPGDDTRHLRNARRLPHHRLARSSSAP
jgi:hypothetical protein